MGQRLSLGRLGHLEGRRGSGDHVRLQVDGGALDAAPRHQRRGIDTYYVVT